MKTKKRDQRHVKFGTMANKETMGQVTAPKETTCPRCHCGQEVLRDSLRVHNSRGEHTRVQGETCSPVAHAPQADKPREGETPRVDELAPQWARNGITGLRQAIAFARDLERELAEAKAERDEARAELEAIGEVLSDNGIQVNSQEPHEKQHPDYIREAFEDRDAARADSQRLDWLEANPDQHPELIAGMWCNVRPPPFPSLRSAIDAAMKGDK